MIAIGFCVSIATISLTVCTDTDSKIILNVGDDMKEKPKAQMSKSQRDYLRIKLAEVLQRRERDCGDYLTSKQPRQVVEALEIIEAWNEAKCNARNTFQEELNIFKDKAKEAILFGTKEEFDKYLNIIEGISYPAFMVDRVTRGKR